MSVRAKVSRFEPIADKPEDQKITEILAEAQRMIEQKKKLLHVNVVPTKIAPHQAERFFNDTIEKAQRMSDLQDRIAGRLKTLPSMPNYHAFERQPGQPTPLILNEAGRTIDMTGKEIQLVHREPTLKANIRAEKRAQFKKAVEETTQGSEIDRSDDFIVNFDARVKTKNALRPRRQLRFREQGEFEQIANRQRAKYRLERLQQEIQSVAKKTGISSAVKLAMVAPKVTELTDAEVPSMEWWDSVLVSGAPAYEEIDIAKMLSSEAITHLVEHPIQMKPPGDTTEKKYLKVYLTKKERKKLRRQNRKEMQREQSEKIRLGLEPPPEPKVKISNLMRVLGTQAVMDPTKMEAHVRDQMAKRLKKHEDANAARKLTPAQRAEKKIKRLKDDSGIGPGHKGNGVRVAVFRVTDLSNQASKFKVEMNAKQLFLTGTVVLHKDVNVVVVEGGSKGIRFYKNLMLRRIRWGVEKGKAARNAIPGDKPKNTCVLVWEGEVKKRSFGEMKFKACPLDKLAREHFQKHNVEHYWDMAYSGVVLEEQEDND